MPIPNCNGVGFFYLCVKMGYMNNIRITKLEKEPAVFFGGKRVVLPKETQKKVDTYWQMLMDAGKSYTRGEVFIVSKKEENDGTLHIIVEKTD